MPEATPLTLVTTKVSACDLMAICRDEDLCPMVVNRLQASIGWDYGCQQTARSGQDCVPSFAHYFYHAVVPGGLMMLQARRLGIVVSMDLSEVPCRLRLERSEIQKPAHHVVPPKPNHSPDYLCSCANSAKMPYSLGPEVSASEASLPSRPYPHLQMASSR